MSIVLLSFINSSGMIWLVCKRKYPFVILSLVIVALFLYGLLLEHRENTLFMLGLIIFHDILLVMIGLWSLIWIIGDDEDDANDDSDDDDPDDDPLGPDWDSLDRLRQGWTSEEASALPS